MKPRKVCDVPFLAPANSWPELVRDPRLQRDVLYLSYYSDAPDRGPALARVDFERHRYASFPQPCGRGAWHVRLLNDGKVWFGMNGPGQPACFDPLSETFEPLPAYRPTAPTTHLTDVVVGPDDRLYFPSYPAGALVAFDRESGAYAEYPVSVEGAHVLFAACVADCGFVGVLNGLRHGVYALDPVSGSGKAVLKSPETLAGRPDAYSNMLRWQGEFLVTLGAGPGAVEVCRYSSVDLSFLASFVVRLPVTSGRRLLLDAAGEPCLSLDGGRIYRLDVTTQTAEPAYTIPQVPSRGAYHFLDPHRILYAGYSQYYGTYDIRTETFDLRRSEVDNPPVGILSTAPSADGNVYCSAHLGVCLSRVHLRTGKASVLGLAHDGSGEIYGSAEVNGCLYSISYTHAVLTAYDPARPWMPGREDACNPRNLGPLGDGQYRPVTGLVHGPGGTLLVGTMPEYGARGGALTVIDPATERWRVFRHLVRDHSVTALAVDESRIYVGTSVVADGIVAPLDEDACLLVFDPVGGSVDSVWRIPGARGIGAMGFGGGRVFFAAAGARGASGLMQFDCATARVRRVRCPKGLGAVSSRMVTAPDGRLIFGCQCDNCGAVAAIDPESATVSILWQCGAVAVVALAVCQDRLLFAQHNALWTMGLGKKSSPRLSMQA